MQAVLIIAPRHYTELYQSFYQHPKVKVDYLAQEDIEEDIARFFVRAKTWQYDGYIGVVDYTALLAAQLNKLRGAAAPDTQAMARMLDKYISRKIQAENGLYDGFFTNTLDDTSEADFPLFLKPRRSTMSFMAHKADSKLEAQKICSQINCDLLLRKNEMWQGLYEHIGFDDFILQGLRSFTAESLQTGNTQVTLDGYVQDGKVSFFGFTKSVFRRNRKSFKRYDFPFHLSPQLEHALKAHAAAAIKAGGINNTLFNIEYKVDTVADTFSLVEVNLRASPQFVYPIWYVSGVNPLDVAVDIVLGNAVTQQPEEATGRVCSVCDLRRNSDTKVLHVPSADEMRWLQKTYPGSLWDPSARPGMKLSDLNQDPHTFRYGQVTIPHRPAAHVKDFETPIEAKILSLMQFRE